MQAQTHTRTHTCTQDKSKLNGILPVFGPMGSNSIDPCTPLQWINLSVYKNTIKRLRAESSKGPKHYWLWRSQGQKITVSTRHLLDIGILSKYKVGSFRRRMTWPNNAVTEKAEPPISSWQPVVVEDISKLEYLPPTAYYQVNSFRYIQNAFRAFWWYQMCMYGVTINMYYI